MREANSSVQRIGSEKGAIHLAVASVDNALWDMYTRSRKKPLQKLVVDMTPVRRDGRSTTFRYITDAITEEEALQLLREKDAGKKERRNRYHMLHPLDEWVTAMKKIVCLTKEAITSGFNHFKMKTGPNVEEDLHQAFLGSRTASSHWMRKMSNSWD
ncbi:hypothetical protein F5887DRAFT_1074551 [Amanita rubescens]|nr:hypothetical protein F5887DRAFT_1074551 [Amanita rubescens]